MRFNDLRKALLIHKLTVQRKVGRFRNKAEGIRNQVSEAYKELPGSNNLDTHVVLNRCGGLVS